MTRPKLRSPALTDDWRESSLVWINRKDWRRVWAVVRAADEWRNMHWQTGAFVLADPAPFERKLTAAVDALRRAQEKKP